MSSRKFFALSDEVIGQLRELLQLSLITGTHIVDNMRQLRLEESDIQPGYLTLTPEYVEYFNNSVEKLMDDLEELKKKELADAGAAVEESLKK